MKLDDIVISKAIVEIWSQDLVDSMKVDVSDIWRYASIRTEGG